MFSSVKRIGMSQQYLFHGICSCANPILQLRLTTGAIKTRFYYRHLAKLATCVRCGVFPESSLKLQCAHHLCEDCVMSTRSYTCNIDSTTTEIQRPLTVPVTPNAALKDAAVLCPECHQYIIFGQIKGHISKQHPKLWMQASPRPLADNQAAVPPEGPYRTPLDGSRQAAALRHQGNESRGGASVWGAAVSPRGPYGNTIDGSRQASALQHKGHESNGGTSAWGLKATPTREPEKTTAAMSFKEKYSVKDVKRLADGILIPFKEKLNPELACCICKALTPTGLKDGKGHTYCAYCTRVHTDALGLFTCSLCGWQAAPSEMSSNGEEWGILEKLTAACPNDNPKCTYQGTFKDVLVHYKSCALKTKVECPLCKSLHDRKTLAFHMAENCPKRVVECKFCNSDIEAWEKEIHEGSCRHRPGTCKYCLQEFSTIIELEEEHQPQCPKMPVKCSFYQLGCSFSAARSDVVVHEATTKHTDMLMEHVCLLKAENESLRRTIENQEKKFQSIINNIKDSLSKIESRTNVAFERRQPRFLRYDPFGINPYRRTLGEGASAGTRQREIEERLAAVEEKLRSYQLPFEQLLRSISDLK